MADLVAIKGSKDGLRVLLDPAAAWTLVLDALRHQLALGGHFFDGAQLTLDVGERPLDETQLSEVLTLMQQYGLQPASLAATTRESRNAARAAGIVARPAPPLVQPVGPEADAMLVWRTVRSGQVVRHAGHITVIGDVNAGGEVIAGGNVVVWGRVRGVVHAGALGSRSAVICALDLRPTQLRIADLIAQPGGGNSSRAPEVARVEGDRISVDGWETYRK
ncbi:MAG: septum site-determining protein MinC [Chloroflexales bacterium]|nr:septum site-determining protein MinC [Chloroflexales bacterium]